ncbi:MAG: hypothetical protein AB1585_04610 [Thermodesulfobacteriota bacterium]
MGIYEQIIEVCKSRDKEILSAFEIKSLVEKRYGSNVSSVIPSDYCYNRINVGIDFKRHIFIYMGGGNFKYVGEKFQYSGKIFFRPKGGDERAVGEWDNGKYYLWEKFPKVSIEHFKPEMNPFGKLDEITIGGLPFEQEGLVGEIPTQEEIIRICRVVAPKDQEIRGELLKRSIEKYFDINGRDLQSGWWEITKKNMMEWSKKR